MSIISFISSWLKNIVILFILISIAELIMPKGNMKRYIDLVIGLLIIFIIITPLAKIMKKNFNLDEVVFNYSKAGDFVEMSNEEFLLEQEKQVEKLYKDKLRNEITTLIEKESTYIVKNISIDLLDNEEKYGEINFLQITLVEDKEESGNDKIEIKKVEPIKINKDVNYDGIEDDKDYKVMKELISTRYSIGEDKINIKNYNKEKGE